MADSWIIEPVGDCFFLFVDLFPAIAIRFVPQSTEIQLGETLYSQLERTQQMDPASGALLQDFAEHLQLSSQYPIRVTVAVSDEANAYAMPGGHIIVNSALLKILDSPESMAALLGHEATHINRRHSLKNLLSEMSTGFLVSLIAGNGGGIAPLLIGNANMLRELQYSRKLEQEADLEGMKLCAKNNLNPSGMVQLMEALQSVHQHGASGNLSFLSTHPLTEDRIEAAEKYIHEHPFKAQSFEINSQLKGYWRQLKSAVSNKAD